MLCGVRMITISPRLFLRFGGCNAAACAKLARQVVRQSGSVVTISDKMGTDYARFFDVPVETVRISSDPNPYALPATQRTGIVYAGNLGPNRIAPLVELLRALGQAALPGFSAIDVYSGEQRPAVLRQITEENGLHYCGRISASEVERLLGRSKFLVFTESFDDKSVRRVKYSLSTKISESLRSGACLLAYGSPQIASIEYLRRHNAARILRSADELPAALLELCSSHDTYAKYVRAAQELAEQCHNQNATIFSCAGYSVTPSKMPHPDRRTLKNKIVRLFLSESAYRLLHKAGEI